MMQMISNFGAILRAPDPLGYRAPKRSNPGDHTFTWSGLVRVESIHPDQKTRASAELVRVVRVVRVKSHIIHMRARAYAYIFFLHIISFLRLEFEFVRNHPDHPDQATASLTFHPDQSPGPTRTTRTKSTPEPMR